jgi:hypothetical protein
MNKIVNAITACMGSPWRFRKAIVDEPGRFTDSIIPGAGYGSCSTQYSELSCNLQAADLIELN